MSVRRTLTLVLIATGALPLIVFGLAFRSVLETHISGDIRFLSRSMLKTLSAQAGLSLLEGTRRDLPALLLLSESYPGSEGAFLRCFGIPHSEYSLLAVLDSSSGIKAEYPAEEGTAGRAYALRARLRPGEVAFSGPFFSELTKSVVVEAAYSNGRKTILVLLDLGEISSKLVLVAQSPRDRLGVVDGDGRYIACSDPSRAQRLELVDPSFLVGGPAKVESEGRRYYASSALIPGTDWRVLYLRATEDADAPMVAFVWAILALVATSVAVTVLVAVFVWKTISVPLAVLIERIDRIAEGRYDERVEGESSAEFREIGQAFNAMADSIERRGKELFLSEERYRLLFSRNRVTALVIDPESGAIRDANEAALSYYGYSMEELLSLRAWDIDDTPRATLKSYGAAVISGDAGRFLARHRLRTGEFRDVELYASPIEIEDRAFLYCVVFDVTQRRIAEERTAKALEEKTLLLREVYHRVKNNLQIVSSLLNMQAESLEEGTARRSLRLAQDRVFTMAAAHELAYQVPDLAFVDAAEYAGKIIVNLQAAYGIQARAVLTDLRPIRLSLEKAIPFGLVLNELASNAIKYAAPTDSAPVRIALEPEADSAWAILSVEDSGPGIPEEVRSKGYKSGSIGLSLIDALARQLDGSATWERGRGGIGTKACVRFSATAQRREE